MATITFDDSGVAENGQYVPEDGQSKGDEGKLPDVSYGLASDLPLRLPKTFTRRVGSVTLALKQTNLIKGSI